ncbi:reverse transcriptase domain-containing protein [Tanacetum coccineum]
MENFYRPSLIGRGDEDANEHLNKYLSITQFMKQNGVSQDSICLNLFPFSLTHEAESWFYHLKTHSIHTWEDMIIKFLSKYYPHSKALQLRKDILNFRILLLNQILTFYNGITMIDQERFMVAVGGNFMRKTPQEAYDLIENMTQHHFQWDTEVYYDTTTGASAHYSKTTSGLNDTDESDEDEPSQKPIHSLSGNPTPSSDSVVESLSPLPTPFGESDSLLEETDTLLSHIDDSFPEYETFCFDMEEKCSGSTTTHSDYSLPDYGAFYFDDDHIEEKSSGSTTTHSDFSLPEYDSFIFDISIDPFPPANRSDSHHEEFADELAHIISPPEYDRFYFDIEPDLGELTILFEENLSKDSTKELTNPELNDFPLLLSDCDSTFSEEFSKIDILVSFPYGNKDKIFNPGIFIIKGVQSERFHILPLDDFYSISFVSAPLFLTDPPEIETFLSFLA